MFCASAPPPEDSDAILVIQSSPGRRLWRRARLRLLLAREIRLHWREIKIAPAALFVTRLAVGHAFVGERKARPGPGRLEIDDDRRIRIGRAEFGRSPGLDNAPAGSELQRRALDIAVPGAV